MPALFTIASRISSKINPIGKLGILYYTYLISRSVKTMKSLVETSMLAGINLLPLR